MTEANILRPVKDILMNYFGTPVKVDTQTLDFMESAYGVSGEQNIISFLGDDSVNDSTIYQLIIHAGEDLRILVEKQLPAGGINRSSIKNLTEVIKSKIESLRINTGNEIFLIPREESRILIVKFIKKLNLDLPVIIIPEKNFRRDLTARMIIRRRNIHLNRKQLETVNKLTALWSGEDILRFKEITSLLLEMIEGNSEDIETVLGNNKYRYRNALEESLNFKEVMKRFTMESIMAQKIQPPLITEDEALSMIEYIDELSVILLGRIIECPGLSSDVIFSSSSDFRLI